MSVPKSLCLGEMRLPVFGLILLMLSACISGWGSTYISLESTVRAAANWIILPLTSLLIVCSRLSPKKIFILCCVICVSGLLAVIDSWFSWNEQYPRLNSVGHVNHSALYLSYCLFSMALVILSVPKFNCIKAFIWLKQRFTSSMDNWRLFAFRFSHFWLVRLLGHSLVRRGKIPKEITWCRDF